MKLSSAALNIDAINGGEWVANLPGLGDFTVKVKGVGNEEYRLLVSRLTRDALRTKRAGEELSTAEVDAIGVRALLETVLIDWANLTDDAGAQIPYSMDRAQEFLADPRYRPIRDGVEWAARIVGDRRAAQMETDAKN